VRELEEELHTEIYPGTEIMTDVGTHHFVKSSAGGHSVLIPQPSDDEHDPLVSFMLAVKYRADRRLAELESVLESISNLLLDLGFVLSRNGTTSLGL
jgi:hypothetical protein